MKKIDKVILSYDTPQVRNVLWIDLNTLTLKVWLDPNWVTISKQEHKDTKDTIVVDHLLSNSFKFALSARQGKLLAERIKELEDHKITSIKGEKGDAFTFDDFTPEQLESLKGVSGENGFTPYIGFNGNWFINGQDTGTRAQGPAGNSLSFNDLTTEQKEQLKGDPGTPGGKGDKGDKGDSGNDGNNGASAFELWLSQQEDQSLTLADFFNYLKNDSTEEFNDINERIEDLEDLIGNIDSVLSIILG